MGRPELHQINARTGQDRAGNARVGLVSPGREGSAKSQKIKNRTRVENGMHCHDSGRWGTVRVRKDLGPSIVPNPSIGNGSVPYVGMYIRFPGNMKTKNI